MTPTQARIRAVVAKIGLDGHYRGVKFVTRTLTDNGVETVYLGANQTVDDVVTAVVQEDADLLALSFLSPDYRQHVPALMKQLRAVGSTDVVVVVGGLIADDDRELLKSVGVRRTFGPATCADDIRVFLEETFPHSSATD
jgi:methylmalonyl-CoA mutase C-terminal domain/subunit